MAESTLKLVHVFLPGLKSHRNPLSYKRNTNPEYCLFVSILVIVDISKCSSSSSNCSYSSIIINLQYCHHHCNRHRHHHRLRHTYFHRYRNFFSFFFNPYKIIIGKFCNICIAATIVIEVENNNDIITIIIILLAKICFYLTLPCFYIQVSPSATPLRF